MNKKKSLQSGFTLIEIMIVISIIAVLSLMSAKSYLSQKKASILKSEIVSLGSELTTTRDSVGHGDFGNGSRANFIKDILSDGDFGSASSGAVAKCIGFEFNKNGVFKFDLPYLGKKTWNSVFDRFEFKGCGDLDKRVLGESLLNSLIKVKSIQKNANEIERFIIVYEPPFGNVSYSFDNKSANLLVDTVLVESLDEKNNNLFEKKSILNENKDLMFNDDLSIIILNAMEFKMKNSEKKDVDNNYDKVVVEFKYGNINDVKSRYIKFDTENDEIDME